MFEKTGAFLGLGGHIPRTMQKVLGEIAIVGRQISGIDEAISYAHDPFYGMSSSEECVELFERTRLAKRLAILRSARAGIIFREHIGLRRKAS